MKLPARLLSIFFTLIAVLSLSSRVSAQEVNIIVSPPRYDAEVNPGETIQKTVKITNGSEKDTVNIITSIHNFIVMDDLGTPVKVTEGSSGRYLASPWFSLDTTPFTLQPRQSKEIIVIIQVPQDALPGGHYAGVFFEPQENKTIQGSGAALSAQVGSLFGITVAGDIKYDALLKEFKTSTPIFEFGPIDFSATIENQSDTHIRPISSIQVTNMFGQKLEDIKLSELNIFPYTSRTLEGEWDRIWGFGRYTATLTAAYGPSGHSASRTIYFWIMPWRIIAAILILIAVLIVVYISVKRHLRHRGDDRDQQIDDLKRRIVELENKQ